MGPIPIARSINSPHKLDFCALKCQHRLRMRQALLLASFFLATPIFIIICVLYLTFSFSEKQKTNFSVNPASSVAYAALPSIDSQISADVTQKDSRIEIVRQFFQKYGSPLVPHASDVVSYADIYGLDFRLIPAIGMQESNLCLKAPPGSNNCWGFGIYGKTVTSFSNYSQAIETVTRTLATHYRNNGLVTPEQIMTIYTPANDGSWARSVRHFMDQLQ